MKLSIKILFLITIGCVLMFFWVLRQPCVNVRLINNGTHSISNIQIIFSGGSHQIPILEPNNQCNVKINSKGESALEIKFIDESGLEHVQPLDVYFEAGYKGEIKIKIDSFFKVSWEAEVKP